MTTNEGSRPSDPRTQSELFTAMSEEFLRLAKEYAEMARAATARAEGMPLIDRIKKEGE